MRARLGGMAGLTLGFLISSSAMWAQTRGHNPDPCADATKLTQADLNECAATELHQAELELEALLKQLGMSPDSPEQKAWVAYRDAQLKAIYPSADISKHGSVYPLCLATLRKTLTDGRIRDLKALITGEGDICAGYKAIGSKSK